MDRNKAKAIHDSLSEAMKVAEYSFSVKLVKSRSVFDDGSVKITYEFHEEAIGSSGVNEKSPKALDYVRWGESHGLKPNLLGERIKVKSDIYLFAGLNENRPKFRVALANIDGSDAGATTMKALPREFWANEEAYIRARKGE